MKNYRVKFQESIKFINGEAQYIEHNGHFYHVCIRQYEALTITDMTHAGKRGMICPGLSVNSHREAPDGAIWDELLSDHALQLLEATTNQVIPSELSKPYFIFYLEKTASKELLPLDLSIIKPLKEEPKKWTVPHVVRALVNGQFKDLKKNYYLTDDYTWDAVVNCKEGPILDVINFVEDIVKRPSGWWVSRSHGAIGICCHSFDSNEFTPVIDPPKKGKETKSQGKVTKPINLKDQKTKADENQKTDNDKLTLAEAKEILKSESLVVQETMTEPKKAGKQPRPFWQVSGRTSGFEQIFYDLGCSRRRWRGAFSFWDCDPSLEIAQAIKGQGRLSFAEQQEKKEERAKQRAERFGQYADNANKRSEQLYKSNQTLLNCMNGTPILVGHHSEKRHRRDLKRIDDRTRKSIEEMDKANYYKDRITNINYKITGQKYDLGYLHNRIKENEAKLRRLERNKSYFSDFESRKQEIDEKLDYYRKAHAQVIQESQEGGKVIPSPSTINKGDFVNYRGVWYPVIRVSKKSVTIKNWLRIESFTWRAPYSEIKEVQRPTQKFLAEYEASTKL